MSEIANATRMLMTVSRMLRFDIALAFTRSARSRSNSASSASMICCSSVSFAVELLGSGSAAAPTPASVPVLAPAPASDGLPTRGSVGARFSKRENERSGKPAYE